MRQAVLSWPLAWQEEAREMRREGFTVPQIATRLAARHGLMRLSPFTVVHWVRGIPAPKGWGVRSLTPKQRSKVKDWTGSIASAAVEYGVHRTTVKRLRDAMVQG